MLQSLMRVRLTRKCSFFWEKPLFLQKSNHPSAYQILKWSGSKPQSCVTFTELLNSHSMSNIKCFGHFASISGAFLSKRCRSHSLISWYLCIYNREISFSKHGFSSSWSIRRCSDRHHLATTVRHLLLFSNHRFKCKVICKNLHKRHGTAVTTALIQNHLFSLFYTSCRINKGSLRCFAHCDFRYTQIQ